MKPRFCEICRMTTQNDRHEEGLTHQMQVKLRLERGLAGEAAAPPAARSTRVDWDTYFMNIAREVATRSTCDRKHVGAVIVYDKTILATGYNGSVRGLPHCDDIGHLMEDGHCVRTVHAESNAIAQAARAGTKIADADIYVTASPCWPCFKMIINAGIVRIVFGEFYRDEKIFDAAKETGIKLVDFSDAKLKELHGL